MKRHHECCCRDLVDINIVVDDESESAKDDGIRYVDMVGPMSDEKSFIDVPCSSKEVVQVRKKIFFT